jgi:hypothetical protein
MIYNFFFRSADYPVTFCDGPKLLILRKPSIFTAFLCCRIWSHSASLFRPPPPAVVFLQHLSGTSQSLWGSQDGPRFLAACEHQFLPKGEPSCTQGACSLGPPAPVPTHTVLHGELPEASYSLCALCTHWQGMAGTQITSQSHLSNICFGRLCEGPLRFAGLSSFPGFLNIPSK